MKLNSTNNLSFGKMYFDYKDQLPTRQQRKIIHGIIKNPLLTVNLEKKLEESDTDIFISTRKGSNEIALRLYSDLDWFGRKIIPADSKYNSLMETFVNPDFESEYTMRMKINNFLKRAENIDLTTPVNVRKINEAIYGHGKIKVQG